MQLNTKPLKNEILEYLEQKIKTDKKILSHIADIIAENSVLDIKKNILKINKNDLKNIFSEKIYNIIPEEIVINFDKKYLVNVAIRDEKESQNNKMEDLIEEIHRIDRKYMKNVNLNEEEQAIEKLLYSEKISDETKEKILQRIEELNKKISILDKRLSVTTKKFYQDPLTGLLSNKFYMEFISDNIVNKRKNDILKHQIFIDNILKISNPAVIFIDFANFKIINDYKGHEKADEILRNFANIFKNDKKIIAIRRSGDEFVMIGDKNHLIEYKEKIEGTDFIKKINGLKSEKDISKNIVTFPAGGIVEIDKNMINKKIKSIDNVNENKKMFTIFIKKAELQCEKNKIILKEKLNQPLSREEGLKRLKKMKNNKEPDR